jgi:hypothetical protein
MSLIEGAPCFTIRPRTDDELGDLFVDVAASLLSKTQGNSVAMQVEIALRVATHFVEAIQELSNE